MRGKFQCYTRMCINRSHSNVVTYHILVMILSLLIIIFIIQLYSKSSSQSAMDTLISKCTSAKKPLVVAGCVPQGSRDLKELEGVSIVGVQQINRVVEVDEETLKGHEVRLLNHKTLLHLIFLRYFIFFSYVKGIFYHNRTSYRRYAQMRD